MSTPPRFRLCLLLTRALCLRDPREVLRESVAGGADLVQIREKEALAAELLDWTEELLPICRELGVPLVVNDAVEVARAAGADGVHVGQDDLHPDDARAILGPQALIGLSTHDEAQLREGLDSAADLLAIGPVHATRTKGYETGIGAAAVESALRLCGGRPLLAIGGITPENRWKIPGEAGVAVSSALCAAEDPRKIARDLTVPSV